MSKKYSVPPTDWYWISPDGESVYGSKRQSIVALSDADYEAWASDGSQPTLWPKDASGAQTDAAMQEVLTPFGLSLPGTLPAAADLVAYANQRQMILALSGFTAVIAGKPVPFATSIDGLTLMNGKVSRLGQPNPPSTVNWQTGPTSFVSIAAADFLAAAIKVSDFVQATFDALPAIFAAITAGTITTHAQIDAAEWPLATG